MAWFPQIHRSHHNNKASFFVYQDKSLAEEVVVVDLGAKIKPGDDIVGEGAQGGLEKRLISTVPREGRALYFAKKRVEYLPEASQAAVELRRKQGAVPARA